MRMCSIASGSSGNCIYTGGEHTHLLVDTGISKKRVEEGLKALDIADFRHVRVRIRVVADGVAFLCHAFYKLRLRLKIIADKEERCLYALLFERVCAGHERTAGRHNVVDQQNGQPSGFGRGEVYIFKDVPSF